MNGQELADKELWKIVKPHVRRIQTEEAVLILDDTVEEKPYLDESELITRKVASGNFARDELAFVGILFLFDAVIDDQNCVRLLNATH